MLSLDKAVIFAGELIVKSAIFEVNLSLLIPPAQIFLSQKEVAGLAFGGPASDFIGVQTKGAAGHANEFRLAFIAAVAPSPPHDRAGPATHSITSSARARIDGGTVRPSALAVLSGHTSLATTQKYIQGDTAAKRNVIKLI